MGNPGRYAGTVVGARRVSGVLAAALVSVLFAACGQSPTKEKGAPEASAPAAQRAAQPAGGSAVQGEVEYAQGDLTINGMPTRIGAVVKSGDTVKTGADGTCEITFEGRNIVQIEPNSLAVLNFESFGRGIQLQSGSLAAVLKELTPTASANRFQLDTPTTVAGVRGTVFYVKVLDPNATYFCLCNGEISLQDNSGGNQQTLEAAHHHAVEYARSGGKITVKSAQLLYHTDAQMQRLASKIGYTIDWNKPDLVN